MAKSPFVIDKVYYIEDKAYYIKDKKDSGQKGLSANFRLVYMGKEGIHHKFYEKVGKWIVTYTDSQLIGKIIEEAK